MIGRRHWQKERSAWVLARAGRRPAARRRGERLMLAARGNERISLGAGDNASNEVATRNVLYRSVFREEGVGNTIGWFLFTCVWVTATLLALGPALLLGWTIYAVRYQLVPRLGYLRVAPLLLASGAVTFVATVLVTVAMHDGWLSFDLVYAMGQLVLGTLYAAWLVRAYGWAAVAARAKGATTKVAAVRVDVHDDAEPIVVDTAIDSEPVAGDEPDWFDGLNEFEDHADLAASWSNDVEEDRLALEEEGALVLEENTTADTDEVPILVASIAPSVVKDNNNAN